MYYNITTDTLININKTVHGKVYVTNVETGDKWVMSIKEFKENWQNTKSVDVDWHRGDTDMDDFLLSVVRSSDYI